ncbi:MAG: hypothetical protein ACOYLB_16565, partial [Phototrophicaceae bacterium]
MFRRYLTILSVIFVLALFGSNVFAQSQNRRSVRLTEGQVIIDRVVSVASPVRDVPFGSGSRVSWGEGTVGSLVTPSGNIISMTETVGVVNQLQFNGTEPVQVISGGVTIVGSLPDAVPEKIALVVNGEVITVTVPVGAVAGVGLIVVGGNVQMEVVAASGGNLVLQDQRRNSIVVGAGEQVSTTGIGGLGLSDFEVVNAPTVLLSRILRQLEYTAGISNIFLRQLEYTAGISNIQ